MQEPNESVRLREYVVRQIHNIFGLDAKEMDVLMSTGGGQHAYYETVNCLRKFNSKYYLDSIDPFNSVTYCIYLYKYSKEMANMGYISIADRIYYLNKMLNAVDLYHGINLPNIWFCEHPVGSVMGRAKYGNNFCFYQNCTVGGNRTVDRKLFYPNIGENVCMYSYSRIIGKCEIGDNVILGTGTSVVNQNVPTNVIVFGTSPNLIFKENNRGIV